MNLVPKPKYSKFNLSQSLKISQVTYSLPEIFAQLKQVVLAYFPYALEDGQNGIIQFILNSELKESQLNVEVNDSGVFIEASDYQGALYGFYIFVQLYQDNLIPYLTLSDYPDLKIRGFMLDISRDKIPTLSSLKVLVRRLSLFRYNHLELYIEGFSFQYDQFRDLPYDTPLTKDEFQELELYAKTYGIDLVGNMNGFGHMAKWLTLEPYRELAEKADGSIQWGYHFPASTLNPLDPKSFQLVQAMITELLEVSSSQYFHLNCDEPFELGLGKSKEACLQFGKSKVYLDYVNKLKSVVESFHKTALIWGDVLINHPEAFDSFPKSLIICDWGYDAGYPFMEHAKMLHEHQISFVLSPGTSSWNSITSRLHDMKITTRDAANAAKKYNGLGVITTDWGDFGHIQSDLFSLPGLAFAGSIMWNEEMEDAELAPFVDKFLLDGQVLYQDLVNLAKISTLESQYVYNGTMAFQTIMFVDPQPSTPIEVKVQGWNAALQSTQYSTQSRDQILSFIDPIYQKYLYPNTLEEKEIHVSMRLLKECMNLHYMMNHQIVIPKEYPNELEEIINLYQQNWLAKNKPGGLDRSLSRLIGLKQIVEYLINKI